MVDPATVTPVPMQVQQTLSSNQHSPFICCIQSHIQTSTLNNNYSLVAMLNNYSYENVGLRAYNQLAVL